MKIYDAMMSSTNVVVLDYLKYNHNSLYAKYNVCLDKVLTNDLLSKELLSEVVSLEKEIVEVTKKENIKLEKYRLLYTINKRVQSYLHDHHFCDRLNNGSYFIFDSIKLYNNEVNDLLTSNFLRVNKRKIIHLTIKGKSLLKLLNDLYKAFQEELTPTAEVEDEDF